MVVGGGSRINTSFLRARLADELILDVEPVIVGEGISLPVHGPMNVKLRLLGIRKLNKNLIQLRYAVDK